jgi:N-acetylneuraminic acid mutarotase
MKSCTLTLISTAALLLSACHLLPTYTIGGEVLGLSGTGLVLQDNRRDNLPISANGIFSFSTPLAIGRPYDVTVQTPPSRQAQNCVVTHGTGTVKANVTNVLVTCTDSITNEWTWMSGSDAVNQLGTYGIQGIAAPSNQPGSRVAAATWTDKSGNLWLFGGYGNALSASGGDLNDLWEYSEGQWTWEGGSDVNEQPGTYGTLGKAAPGNFPGARYEAAGSADAAGDFWLFGGLGIDSKGTRGELNDLWRYSGGEWTWMSGLNTLIESAPVPGVYGTKGIAAPHNVPGARVDAASWTDPSGNFWLFGGEGYDSTGTLGLLNDLWKFNGSEWTWMSGSKLQGQIGTYGTLGTASPRNVPGSRTKPVTWADAAGNLWLFGGEGNDSTKVPLCVREPGNPCLLNDLWKYGSGQWTWMGGSERMDQYGTYGTQGVAAAGNIPGARWFATGATDAVGNFWLFGGIALDSSGKYYGDINDLWEYSAGEWTWVSGSNLADKTGTYGVQGIAAADNVPGCRDSAMSWIDASGNLWLFAGGDYNSIAFGGKFNDLWKYGP